ncbi:hypothetical protein MMC27_007160 [Xylographa pallens]|nr:hypothetical protein [Xylographa pallens]
MPSYHSTSHAPDPYRRWDHSVVNNDYRSSGSQSPYHDPLRSSRSAVLSMPAPQPRYSPRQRWPPSPSVEDEVISLSREHSPVLPDLVGGEAQERGALDQMPIILDANPSPPLRVKTDHPNATHKGDWQSLGSKSSSESIGPLTPPDSANTDNQDRRYIWRPEPNIDIPETYDDPKLPPRVRGQANKSQTSETTSQRRVQSSDVKHEIKSDDQRSPLRSGRESSPYAYSSNSGKSATSWDYLTSPDVLSPEARLPTLPIERKARIHELNQNAYTNEGRHRAASTSGSWPERPLFGRYQTDKAYPGQSQPMKIPQSPSRRVDLSSDESDLSQKETLNNRPAKRDTGYSFVRPEQPRQASALRYDEAVYQSRKNSVHPLRPLTPPRSFSATLNNLPLAKHYNHGTSMPATAPLPLKPAMTSNKYSPRPSPGSSPGSSPPPSPRPTFERHSAETSSIGRRSRPTSRPASPFSSTESSRPATLDLPNELHFRDYQPINVPKSRHTSPLPSPKPSHPTTYYDAPLASPKPSPTNRSRSSTHTLEIPHRPRSREASAPFILSQPPRTQTLGIPHDVRTHSAVDPGEIPHFGSDSPYRTPSEYPLTLPPKSPIKKQRSPRFPPYLPACPRPDFSTGHNDWSSLYGCPGFDVCPTCRRGIEDTGWEGQFYPSPPRPYGYETRCDLSIAWVRMAWLQLLSNKAPHPNIVHHIIEAVSNEPPCPGKAGAVRNWYRLPDPETNRLVSNFDVCPYCVRSIETLFPNLRNTFHLAPASNASQKRMCDLRVESKRFAKYVDHLEEISTQANLYRRPPNMLRFVQFAQKMSEFRECTRDDMVLGQPWHFMPHLPEFTVCEECYNDIVWPAAAAGSEVAGSFNRTLQVLPPNAMGTSCQLYSDRMRELFEGACRRNDWAGLRSAVLQRVRIERDLQARLAYVKMYGGDKVAEEVQGLVAEWKRWE